MAKKTVPPRDSYDALVLADAHISPTDTAWANSGIKGDARYALEQCVALAKESEVQLVVGLGDLNDRQVNRSLAPSVWFKALYDLEDAGIGFVFIQGNHDFDTPPWLASHRNARHVHGKQFAVGKRICYGLDYQPIDTLKDALAKIPEDTDVLLCHQGWSEWMGIEGSFQGTLRDIPHVKLVLSGDLHKNVYGEYLGASGQRFKVFSPGATCMQSLGEPDEHFCLLLAGNGDVRQVKLNSRAVLRSLKLSTPEELDRYIMMLPTMIATANADAENAGVPYEIRKPILRTSYSSRLTDAMRRVSKAVGDDAFLFWDQFAPEEAKAGVVTSATEAATLVSALGQSVDRAVKPKLYNLLASLLTAKDKKQAEVQFRSEFMKEDE